MNNRAYGTQGEQEAVRYLTRHGLHILCRNFRVGRMGEIDIIGMDGETLCFIEVKTRSSDLFGSPAQAVSNSKQANIKRIALIYMQRFGYLDCPVRFDIVELIMERDGQVKRIEFIQNAF